MNRCIALAKQGAGAVAPNPMVGAVLVYKDRILGEGYHQLFGQAHAEVNCIESVRKEDEPYIRQAILYVSLEPCAHFGKTPPCVDLIILKKIPKVYIGCPDPFVSVNGKGIEKLSRAGVEVIVGILEKKCVELNKRFFLFHQKRRPYTILKWAQSSDCLIAATNFQRLLISNNCTNRLVHKWRAEEAGILVGTNTALKDNPSLTTRLWKGPNPVRLILDLDLHLPHSLTVFNGEFKTIVFNVIKQEERGNLLFYKLSSRENLLPQLMSALYELQIQSILVEGGATILQTFIDAGIWDEARLIVNNELIIGKGLPAPVLKNQSLVCSELILSDSIYYYKNQNH